MQGTGEENWRETIDTEHLADPASGSQTFSCQTHHWRLPDLEARKRSNNKPLTRATTGGRNPKHKAPKPPGPSPLAAARPGGEEAQRRDLGVGHATDEDHQH